MLKVIISNSQKKVKVPAGLRLLIRRSCNAVLSLENIMEPSEVNISFIDNNEIRSLNEQYRNIDKPTDVLSFPFGENGKYDKNPQTGAIMLGEIVISIEKAVSQADYYGHSLQREIGYLTVHAMLHLLGYDHELGGIDAVRMREKEEHVMSLMGLSKDASYSLQEGIG